MNSPLVSVIMPVYNAENFIHQAISSILNQTHPNIELIICDDGSEDNTIEIINSIKDDRIKIYKNEKNIGNLLTTNKLFSYCNGDYIALQDADDYSEIDRIENQLNCIYSENADLVSGSIGILKNENIINIIENPKYHEEIISFIKKRKNFPMIWGAIFFKKIIYDDIGGFNIFFDRKGAADIEWMIRALKKYKGFNFDKQVYIYRQHLGSLTKNIEINNSNLVARLYSEDIALDTFDLQKNPNIDFFEMRLNFYRNEFHRNKSKLLNIYFNNLTLGGIDYFFVLKKIFFLKSGYKQKIKFLGMMAILFFFGNNFLEFIKNKMR